MEIILLLPRIVYWLFIAPLWWLAINLAGMFYPYEGDKGHFILSVLLTGAMMAAITLFIYYMW